MLNKYNQNINNTTISINACSGGIYKTYPKSFFKRFHLNSPLAETLFEEDPHLKLKTGEKFKVVVLQMVICGDMEVMAEIIRKSDFDVVLEQQYKMD